MPIWPSKEMRIEIDGDGNLKLWIEGLPIRTANEATTSVEIDEANVLHIEISAKNAVVRGAPLWEEEEP